MTAAPSFCREHPAAPPSAPVRDPVCGMAVDPGTAHRAEHAGAGYFFCSARCRDRFVAEPARYLADPDGHTSDVAAPEAGGARWTCPMHPQIVRPGPGSCPICGMALEPMTPSAGEAANPELRDMTRRFWTGVALSLPLLAIVMAQHFDKPAVDAAIARRFLVWVQLALAT